MTELDHRSHTQRKLCPICGHHSVGEIRFGINLTPLKARILDCIATKPEGVPAADIQAAFSMSRVTLKAHLYQLNQAIGRTGYRIYTRARTVYLINGPPPRKRWWRQLPSSRES